MHIYIYIERERDTSLFMCVVLCCFKRGISAIAQTSLDLLKIYMVVDSIPTWFGIWVSILPRSVFDLQGPKLMLDPLPAPLAEPTHWSAEPTHGCASFSRHVWSPPIIYVCRGTGKASRAWARPGMLTCQKCKPMATSHDSLICQP